MKKTAMIALAILLAATSVNAQNGYDSKHEVAFGYGMFSNSQIFDALSTYVATEAGVTFSNAKYNGSLAVEYLHRVNNWFGYGGEFVYRSSSVDFSTIEGVQKEGTSTRNYFTLRPPSNLTGCAPSTSGSTLRLLWVSQCTPGRTYTLTAATRKATAHSC